MRICRKSDLILYVYAALLVGMNFIRVFDNAFWGDEGYTIRLAKMTVENMVVTTAADVHPPLYYLLTQLLYHLFGNQGFAYHLSGLLPYIAIVMIGCTIIKKYFGIIPAAILITMSSLMRNAVIYNVEARMYSLAAMFILIAYIAYYRVLEKNNLASWTVFVLASLCAAYTHYYALISAAFLYAMLLPLAILREKYRKGLVISYGVAILAYLPWLMILLNSFSRTANNWWLKTIPTISASFKFLLDYKWLAIFFLISLLVFAVKQMNLLSVQLSDMKKTKEIHIKIHPFEELQWSDKLYWVVAGLISIGGTIAVGLALSYLIRPFFVLRYLFPVSAMMYIIFGVCVSEMKLPRLWNVVLVGLIFCVQVPDYVKKYNNDYRLNIETTRFLEAVRPGRDVKLITNNGHLGWTLLEYYFPENISAVDTGKLNKLDEAGKEIWLIWQKEISEEAKANISKKHFAISKIYEGYFANGPYYHVYQLHKND